MKIEHSIAINQPVERVFAFVTNFANLPQWAAAALEAEQTSSGELGVGATLRVLGKAAGKRIESHYRVTEYERNRTLAYVSTAAPVQNDWRFSFEEIGTGTLLTEVIEGEPGGFFKLAAPILQSMLARQFAADLGNLKDLLEADSYTC